MTMWIRSSTTAMKVQLQLLYGNPMYTSPAGKLPDSITPTPPPSTIAT